MTKRKLASLKAGIKPYKKQQAVLLRLLRMKGGITADEFDTVFSSYRRVICKDGLPKVLRRKPRFGFSYMPFHAHMLGDMYGGEWSKWLDLTQIMAAIGLVKIDRVGGVVRYGAD